MKLIRSGNRLLNEMSRTVPPKNGLALWALGQEGFLVKVEDHTILFDPFLSHSPKRRFEPPLTPEQCADVDFVICSHHHDDHMDPVTLKGMKHSLKTRFIVPRAHLHMMKEWGFHDSQLIGISHLETIDLGPFQLSAHAALHDKFEQDEQGEHLYLGYVMKLNEVVLYHAGDTLGFTALRDWLKEKQVDIALIPINGQDFTRREQGIIGNCNYREAADLAVSIQSDILIPMHFGLFPYNDENPAYLVDYLYTHHPEQKFHLMVPGERFIYVKTYREDDYFDN